MKYWGLSLLLICLAACGPSDSSNAAETDTQSVADQAVVEAKETAQRIKDGGSMDEAEGTEGCRVFNSGLIEDFFQTGETVVSYKESIPSRRSGHVVCFARWDKPNKEALKQAYQEALMEWAKTMASPDKKPQPKPESGENEVSLTLVANSFDSADEAVASLEDTVTTLTEGISFEVGGKQHETKMTFGPWVDGVGDKAIFSDKGGLMFANAGKRYSLKVAAMANKEQNQQKAIELAQHIIDQL